MEQSMTLMTAHVHFINERVSLVHIPLEQYSRYLQPLLQLISRSKPKAQLEDDQNEDDIANTSWANQHSFLNVSVTPIECSVVCSTALARDVFGPVIQRVNESIASEEGCATISSEDFVVISVEGEGLEAGQRVLELTTPLAMAGISIFFITTYFSDYILVPAKSRGQVVHALEERGFTFEQSSDTYVNPGAHHHRHPSSASSLDAASHSPATPPPTSVHELQVRTFSLLKRRDIIPTVRRDIRLIQCAGPRENIMPNSHSADNPELQMGLVKCLIEQPRFLSLTLTGMEAPSLLLEKDLLSHFGPPENNVLLGNKDSYLIPITLNLHPLPFEATGIVCGVAGKMVGGTNGRLTEAVDMSYLSTTRTGTVMVDETEVERAVEMLRSGEWGLDVV